MNNIYLNIDQYLKHQMSSGLAITFGNDKNIQYIYKGRKNEDDNINGINQFVNENTLFDLSSVSKFFTLIIVMKCVENGILNLKDKIAVCDPRFIHLGQLSIEDILSYQVEIRTSSRIENCQNIKEVEELLLNATYLENKGIYSDLPAMILKMIVEHVTSYKFYDLIKEWILETCQMKNTFIHIPECRVQDCISNNYEMRIVNNQLIVFDNILPGVCNDGKARLFHDNEFAGHAGLFSTIQDMGKLCQCFLNEKLLKKETIEQISINRTGTKIDENKYTKYFGYLCYVKHPVRRDSEVHPLLSDNAFAFGGYTGNQLTIDFNNKVFLFMAANRCHHRVTQIIPISDIDKYVKEEGEKEYIYFDDQKYLYSKNFVYKRDDYVINPIVEYLIKNKE